MKTRKNLQAEIAARWLRSLSVSVILLGAVLSLWHLSSRSVKANAQPGLLIGQQTKLMASDGAVDDVFGQAVALSGDTAIVGANGDAGNTGAAYLFGRNQGGADNWGQVKKLVAPDGTTGNNFGISVALSGDLIIIGAINADGIKGAAYLFGRNQGGANNWGLVKKLTASDAAAFDSFGHAVAVSGDTVIVTATGDDSIKGAAYVFGRNQGGANNWGQVKKLTASDGGAFERFGDAVALGGDTAIIGARYAAGDQGAAYVIARNQGGANNWGEVKRLTASDGMFPDDFGSVVALSGDTALIGANGDDLSKGAAYVFERNQGGVNNWGEVKKLVAAGGVVNDVFGFSVSLSTDKALIGAPLDAFDQGAVYVFERNQGGANNWGQVEKLTAADGADSDQFGFAVALSGNTGIVGTVGDDGDKGSAYILVGNTEPEISTVAVTRTAGSGGSNSTIANVSDLEDAGNTLAVTVNGVIVTAGRP